MKKLDFEYRGWQCRWNSAIQGWYLYSPAEAKAAWKTYETVCCTVAQCKEFINSYK